MEAINDQATWLSEQAPKLILFARQWVPCHADAEDVFHTAFVRFWRHRDRVRDPIPFLYTCVRRAALNWCRERGRREKRERAVDSEPLFATAHDRVAKAETDKAIEEALLRLSDEQREVVVMRIWGELIMETTSLPAGKGALSPEEQEELMEPRTTEVMESGPNRRRMEWDEWNGRKAGGRRVQIWDGNQRKQLMLFPAAKQALLYDYTDEPEDETVGNEDQGSASPQYPPKQPRTVVLFRSLLRDTVQKPGAQRDSLGEKEIDGRRVVGFRLSVRGVTIDVWGDPKTRLPVRIESTIAVAPHLKITESNFEFNVPMDETLFSLEPPAGYEVIVKDSQPRDKSSKTEKDLIDLFRYYGQWSGGRFPDVLDWQWIEEVLSEARRLDAHLTHIPQAEREQQFEEGSKKLQRAMGFMLQLTKDSDWHYGGKGVSIDAADTPVFWYRPNHSKTYRVVYADLSVRDADTPPSMPAELPEPGRPQGDCTIAVKVVDEATGSPVPDAHVYLFYHPTSHSMGVTTDRDGSHVFENVDTSALEYPGNRALISRPVRRLHPSDLIPTERTEMPID